MKTASPSSWRRTARCGGNGGALALPCATPIAIRTPRRPSLDEMVKRQGWTSTAARLAPDPTQLGALHGRSGLFAGRGAKLERAGAIGAASAVASHLERIGAAEAKAARTYRASVEAQREADATPVPKLSARAEAAVAALAAAPDERVRADLWRAFTADKVMAAELERFSAAVRQRFGEDTVRAMLRAEGGSVETPSVPRQHRAALTRSAGPSTHSGKASAPAPVRPRPSVSRRVRG